MTYSYHFMSRNLGDLKGFQRFEPRQMFVHPYRSDSTWVHTIFLSHASNPLCLSWDESVVSGGQPISLPVHVLSHAAVGIAHFGLYVSYREAPEVRGCTTRI